MRSDGGAIDSPILTAGARGSVGISPAGDSRWRALSRTHRSWSPWARRGLRAIFGRPTLRAEPCRPSRRSWPRPLRRVRAVRPVAHGECARVLPLRSGASLPGLRCFHGFLRMTWSRATLGGESALDRVCRSGRQWRSSGGCARLLFGVFAVPHDEQDRDSHHHDPRAAGFHDRRGKLLVVQRSSGPRNWSG